MYCPFMKEMCVEGWTKSMGQDESTGERPCCRYWTLLRGKDPQSDQYVDRGDCCFAWAPVTQTEASQMIRNNVIVSEQLREELIAIKQNLSK